ESVVHARRGAHERQQIEFLQLQREIPTEIWPDSQRPFQAAHRKFDEAVVVVVREIDAPQEECDIRDQEYGDGRCTDAGFFERIPRGPSVVTSTRDIADD